jgi:hypothetical protein
MNDEDFIDYEGKEIEFETKYPRMKLKGLVKKDNNSYYIEVNENSFSATVPVKFVFKIIKGDEK